MAKRIYYARSRDGDDDTAHWQTLEAHLHATAELARSFCIDQPWASWAQSAGLWHDIGKYSEEFQRRLAGSGARVVHSTAGAVEAARVFTNVAAREPYIARILGYVIVGHHAGLPDGNSDEDSCLNKRIATDRTDYSGYEELNLVKPPLGIRDLDSILSCRADKREAAFALAFFIRMLFSCLVDADRLDSEAFCDPNKHALRERYPEIKSLYKKLIAHLDELSKRNPEKPINRIRARVLAECRVAAEEPQGVFSLTVPTGGGKTLSSLAFALSHAIRHGLRRIIYVIPYTSIIEQNADVFRACLGSDAVVEHHSNFDVEDEKEDLPRRLAAENWDAPLIITTNVQFFESLFSHHPSRCRKLHNIMNSVVILDEAQMLPVDLLQPCVGALRELAENPARYRTTVLLCTATQPALGKDDGLKRGFASVREIIKDRETLYSDLRRVKASNLGKCSEQDIVRKFLSRSRALCIVNTKARARRFFDAAKFDGDVYHLSASMCPAHRTERLKEIRSRLDANEFCRVVSTQVIEAGVDIDFPVVFREIAGLDSLIQAAGRCNREGAHDEGTLFVFETEEGVPQLFRQQTQAAQSVMRTHGDLFSLDAIHAYFKSLYWAKGDEALDAKKMYDILERSIGSSIDIPFRKIGESFQLIDNDTRGLVIPWGIKGEEIVDELQKGEPDKHLLRKAQSYSVNVFCKPLEALVKAHDVKAVNESLYILTTPNLYDKDTGLAIGDSYFIV